jgi:para-nitrobenzyl esterase
MKMRHAGLGLAACGLAATIAACAPPPASGPVPAPAPVQLDSWLLAGVPGRDASLRVFKGVPYAAPPIFDLRWRSPQPPAKWTGVRQADRFAPACFQLGRGWGEFYQAEFFQHPEPMSEDCLYLNVWAGPPGERASRPVLVWIHGGAFAEGSGSLPSFDGEALAKKGLVVVTINYRLNVFGFMAHPDLTKESSQGSSGNYGLLDQVAALQWVQRNIAAFGGDAARVTVAGQSAGSSSVHFLESSPLAKGLFARAIAQSGSGVDRAVNTVRLKDAEAAGVSYAKALAALSAKELRAKPAAALLQGELRFRPNLDGWVVPDDPAAVMIAGRQNDVPTLTGMTADEQVGFQPRTVKASEFRDAMTKRFGAMAAAFGALYPAATDEQARVARDASARDQTAVSLRAWAAMRARTAKTPLYIYYFSRPSPGRDSEHIGAFHSGELEYIFGTLDATDRPWEAIDRKLSETMSSYWANFAGTGDPNGAGLPKWPSFGDDSLGFMELGERQGPRSFLPDKAKVDFFEAYFAKLLSGRR